MASKKAALTIISVKFESSTLDRIDDVVAKMPPTVGVRRGRSEVIRHLVQRGLPAQKKSRKK